MRRNRSLYFAIMVMTTWFVTACMAKYPIKSTPSPTPRSPIDLTLKDLQGSTVHLRELRGRVVLVNFWASWCSPCREEMPILDAFYQAHKSRNFTLVAINVSESASDAAEYVGERGYTFQVWSDPTGDTMIELGVNGLPASILLNEEGRLQKVWFGPLTTEMLNKAVLPLLE